MFQKLKEIVLTNNHLLLSISQKLKTSNVINIYIGFPSSCFRCIPQKVNQFHNIQGKKKEDTALLHLHMSMFARQNDISYNPINTLGFIDLKNTKKLSPFLVTYHQSSQASQVKCKPAAAVCCRL